MSLSVHTSPDRPHPVRSKIACVSSARWNPYLRLLYKHLGEAGVPVVWDARLRVPWLWRCRKEVSFLHLHWPESQYRFRRGPRFLHSPLSWVKLAVFLVRLTAARLLGYRLVWTVHQVYPHESESRYRERLAARLLARFCSLLLAHDLATADAVRAELPRRARKLEIVPHGSYIGVYPSDRDRKVVRSELGIVDDAFVFLCFGELRAYKEIGLLLDAFRNTPLPHARLIVAGNPKDRDVADTLEGVAAADSRIVPRLGWVPESAVAELFQACDVAVVPRSDGGTSGSLILAMSLGLPVVVADMPAYRTLTGGPKAAWLFVPGDAASLREALLVAARDPTDAARRGREARAAAERLSWPDIAGRIAVLLRAQTPAGRHGD